MFLKGGYSVSGLTLTVTVSLDGYCFSAVPVWLRSRDNIHDIVECFVVSLVDTTGHHTVLGRMSCHFIVASMIIWVDSGEWKMGNVVTIATLNNTFI